MVIVFLVDLSYNTSTITTGCAAAASYHPRSLQTLSSQLDCEIFHFYQCYCSDLWTKFEHLIDVFKQSAEKLSFFFHLFTVDYISSCSQSVLKVCLLAGGSF